jgi:hypothetical protein
MGIFFSKYHELVTDPKYISLHEWANLHHLAVSSSVGTRKKCIQATLLMMYCNDAL